MGEPIIVDRNNVSWHEAPLPGRWHRCQPWTSGVLDGHLVDRCACGAMQVDTDGWTERNSRRKGK